MAESLAQCNLTNLDCADQAPLHKSPHNHILQRLRAYHCRASVTVRGNMFDVLQGLLPHHSDVTDCKVSRIMCRSTMGGCGSGQKLCNKTGGVVWGRE